MANFEAFRWSISLSTNLLFLKSAFDAKNFGAACEVTNICLFLPNFQHFARPLLNFDPLQTYERAKKCGNDYWRGNTQVRVIEKDFKSKYIIFDIYLDIIFTK